MTYLKFFTFLSQQEIEALEAATASAPEKREAQRGAGATRSRRSCTAANPRTCRERERDAVRR